MKNSSLSSLKKKMPKRPRAIQSAYYAVIVEGRRQVIYHYSGEPLKGKLS